jgi:hypothetical protein
MENNLAFLSKPAGWLEGLGLPYISVFEAILILMAAFLVLLLILWLVFREARLWYWKTDIQIDPLKSIDSRLQNVENKLSPEFFKSVDTEESEPPAQDIKGQPSMTVQEKAAQEREGFFAVGRSGRIYTEAELELQIRE